MSKALNATGRPILYSLCNWGEDYPFNWASTIANSWRITGDIFDDWDRADSRCPWYELCFGIWEKVLKDVVMVLMHGIVDSRVSIAR